jgi:hypothetical protein
MKNATERKWFRSMAFFSCASFQYLKRPEISQRTVHALQSLNFRRPGGAPARYGFTVTADTGVNVPFISTQKLEYM